MEVIASMSVHKGVRASAPLINYNIHAIITCRRYYEQAFFPYPFFNSWVFEKIENHDNKEKNYQFLSMSDRHLHAVTCSNMINIQETKCMKSNVSNELLLNPLVLLYFPWNSLSKVYRTNKRMAQLREPMKIGLDILKLI
jgi:hypothetical protein